MEYHVNSKKADPADICEDLIDVALCVHARKKCPKVRFGKTELQMPIVTCGGMRIQQTWMPDDIPVLGPKKISHIGKKCQNNLIECVRLSLKLGINHFETARFYGTSELQLVDALSQMIDAGEIKREDIIVQTKVSPAETNEDFKKTFNKSWKHMSKIGYIDLFSFHGLNNDKHYDWVFQEGGESRERRESIRSVKETSHSSIFSNSLNSFIPSLGNYEVAKELLAEGKIKHVGFSTHGTPDLIRKTIETDKMEYVNLHFHYFGSYHASYYEDGEGGHGNALNVKLAKEKDMGVFVISPIDKGGALYSPTGTLVDACFPLSPITFQCMWLWEQGVDTLSIGISKPSDFDEVFAAALQSQVPKSKEFVASAVSKLERIWDGNIGPFKDWWKGIPTMWEERSQGIAVCHIIWLWTLVKAFGMVTFARDRYKSMEKENAKWKKGKDTLTNISNFSFNPGRHWEPDVNYDAMLEGNPFKKEIISRMRDTHEWLNSKDGSKKSGSNQAYTISTWESFPGDEPSVKDVIMQNVSGGMAGAGGGVTSDYKSLVAQMRKQFAPPRGYE
jgi:uncharacterized protein